VQIGHFLGGPLVDGGLLLGDHAFITGQKKQGVNVRGQFSKGETEGFSVVLAIVEMDMGKIADQDGKGKLVHGQAGQVFGGLLVGQRQVLAGGLHLDEEQAGEKAVYPAMAATQFSGPMLEADGL
jgi:hypothetical protein